MIRHCVFSAASTLCLHFCLPMSLLWDARHKWVNQSLTGELCQEHEPANHEQSHVGRIKPKSAFKCAKLQIQFILHIQKISSRPLLSIHTFYADAHADLGLHCPHMPKDIFIMVWPIYMCRRPDWNLGRSRIC